MRIIPLPAFSDNYIWVLHDGCHAVVVDPGSADVVETFLAREKLELTGILITHHHADHTGGIAALCKQREVVVYGPAHETIAGVTHPVRAGETVSFTCPDLTLTVLEVPGHTIGHIAFYGPETEGMAGMVFCGDTLFSAGCGRLFEGTAVQMMDSLALLAALPGPTRVYCAHEYTLSNLAFACAAEPDNPVRDRYFADCRALREQGMPTLPTTIAQERAINPFLRAREPGVMSAVAAHAGNIRPMDAVTCFAALREWKNGFRG